MKNEFEFEEGLFSRQFVMRILITLLEVAVVIFLAYVITRHGLETMMVSGDSMSPTLVSGDEVLINKMSYKFHKARRNDVVVVKENGSEHSYYSIMRVVGLPGEKIKISDSEIYIDGKKMKQKFDFPRMENGGMALEEISLDSDEYFMLCDNRNACEDSRNASVGNIKKSDIVGKAWIRTDSIAFINMLDNFGAEDTSSE